MSVYGYAQNPKYRYRLTPMHLQRLWEDGWLFIVYHRETKNIVARSRYFKSAIAAKKKNAQHGLILLCDQRVYPTIG